MRINDTLMDLFAFSTVNISKKKNSISTFIIYIETRFIVNDTSELKITSDAIHDSILFAWSKNNTWQWVMDRIYIFMRSNFFFSRRIQSSSDWFHLFFTWIRPHTVDVLMILTLINLYMCARLAVNNIYISVEEKKGTIDCCIKQVIISQLKRWQNRITLNHHGAVVGKIAQFHLIFQKSLSNLKIYYLNATK